MKVIEKQERREKQLMNALFLQSVKISEKYLAFVDSTVDRVRFMSSCV